MIDASELRIGNWVWVSYPIEINLETYTAGKEIAQVISINKNSTLDLLGIEYPKTNWINCTMAEPIPLTTKILLQIGFTERIPDSENVNSWRLKDTNVILNQYKSDTSYYYLYPALWYPTRHIKYLHEVQNITYYLTENELEIKL